MPDESRLEEKAIERFIKTVLASQLDGVKKLAVDIQTNLLKLIQGQADSIEVTGKGIISEDVEIQEINVQTDEISIDPLSILLGKIRLNEPIDSYIRLVLTEENLNHTLNSEIAIENLKPLQLEVEGENVLVEIEPPFIIRLLRNNKIRFTGTLKIQEAQKTRQTTFTGLICPRTETQPILLETFCCAPNQGSSIPFLIALMRKVEFFVNQPYFQFDETILRVKSLTIQEKNLIVEIEANIQQIST